MKKLVSCLLLAAALMLGCIVPAAAEEGAVLTITPDVTDAVAGTEPVSIVYTITVTPPAGQEVGVFSFRLRPSGQMTLPADFVEDGQTVITLADNGLAKRSTWGPRVFSTYEYTPESAFFAAVGSKAKYRMTDEAEIMTIRATVPAGTAGAFVLDADFTIALDGSGVTYPATIKTEPVIITAPDVPGEKVKHSGAVAVTGLREPVAGEMPDEELTVDVSLPEKPSTTLTWLCDGVAMNGEAFAPGHMYTVLIFVKASGGEFDASVTANAGFTVRRIDDTHVELSRVFRVAEHYTEALTPEEAAEKPELVPDTVPDWEEYMSQPQPQSQPGTEPASETGSQGGTAAAAVVVAAAALLLAGVQLCVPGGVAALLRRGKRQSTKDQIK